MAFGLGMSSMAQVFMAGAPESDAVRRSGLRLSAGELSSLGDAGWNVSPREDTGSGWNWLQRARGTGRDSWEWLTSGDLLMLGRVPEETMESQGDGPVLIRFQATDLVDQVQGQDLWRYDYQLGAIPLKANEGFTIYFDAARYENLQNPPPVPNGDLDAITIQPDPILQADGFYDVLATVDDPSLAGDFSVSFIWKGSGVPGAQNFEIYNTSFQVIASGVTVVVPEPAVAASIMAVGLGVFCAAGRLRRRRSK
jgi:MYXO-CTERM domain-containing protein